MTITYHKEVVQGSDEWHQMRVGLLTASEMHLIVTPTLKAANNEKERSHLYELLAQRLTGYVEPQYVSDAMLRGQSDEIAAIELYAKNYAPIERAGFITNDKWGFTIGYSPDALVGDDGLVECKSRSQKYQVQTITDNAIPAEYMIQLQTGLLVTERAWIDFISYSGGLPMFVKRCEPIKEYQEAIVAAAEAFEKRLAEKQQAYLKNIVGLHPTERVIEQEMI
jgi:predicted phage-related endonuclease